MCMCVCHKSKHAHALVVAADEYAHALILAALRESIPSFAYQIRHHLHHLTLQAPTESTK